MSTPTFIRWRVLSVLVLASFVSYILRYNVSTAGPAMIADLNLTEIQFGWILAAFTVGYTVFQLPGGLFGDRFGPKRALTIIAVLWALFTILTALIPGPGMASTTIIIASLMLVRFLVGAAHAPIYPVTNVVVRRWFPVGGWALPNGLSSTGLTLGIAVSAPLLAWMIAQVGWRVSFVMMAPIGFVVAGFWWWYARDDPAQHPGINTAEVELIAAGRAEQSNKEESGNWLDVVKNRDILLLTISYFCTNYVFYEVFNWFFYYLVTIREFGAQEAGFLTSSQWIAGAVGATFGGWLCDYLCGRFGMRWGCRWPAIIGMTLAGIFLVVGAFTSNPYLAVGLLAGCFLFSQFTEATYWTASIAIGGDQAGTAGGVMNTGGNVVGFVNALLVPYIAQTFGWDFAIASGGVFAFIAAGLWFFIRPDHSISTTTKSTSL
ncbi:MAG: ACS family glucarate transporter-like MFS transporter [Planctomycetota bacterium]|jgi:ACS family glucarate transporter-like MFS transporter